MLKFSEMFEFSREKSYFERIRMLRMVRMVRSLADRTFQLWRERSAAAEVGELDVPARADDDVLRLQVAEEKPVVVQMQKRSQNLTGSEECGLRL